MKGVLVRMLADKSADVINLKVPTHLHKIEHNRTK